MAGTITQRFQSFGSRRDGTTTFKFTLACTGDSTNGSFPATALGFKRQLRGARLESVEVKGGSPSPTDLWDLTILDDVGFDLLNGSGKDRSATTVQRIYPTTTNASGIKVATNGDSIVNISGNSVASANITIAIWFSK